MATMNVSLPDEMKAFVETQAAKEGFGTTSEYLRSVIRDVQKRQAKQAWKPSSARRSQSGPAEPMTREDWDEIETRRARTARSRAAGRAMSHASMPPQCPPGPGGYLRLSRATWVSSAHRFLREVDADFQRLAAIPGNWPRYEPDDPLFEGVRFFPVSRFKNTCVFYRPIEGGIEVLRVLHGARDIQGLLAEGFETPRRRGRPARRGAGITVTPLVPRHFAFPWLATAAAARATSSGSPR